MNIMCKICGCYFDVTQEVVDSGVCPVCGTTLDADIISNFNNEAQNNGSKSSRELMRIPCYLKTIFKDYTLIIYKTHLTLVSDSDNSIVFNVRFEDILCMKKHKNPLFMNLMILELKDGTIYKFSLNGNYNLEGEYERNNAEIIQLCKTLPNYVNKLVAELNN